MSDDICYVCYDIDNTHIKHCNTIKCNSRIYKECLCEQILSGDMKCGCCR